MEAHLTNINDAYAIRNNDQMVPSLAHAECAEDTGERPRWMCGDGDGEKTVACSVIGGVGFSFFLAPLAHSKSNSP